MDSINCYLCFTNDDKERVETFVSPDVFKSVIKDISKIFEIITTVHEDYRYFYFFRFADVVYIGSCSAWLDI